MYVSIKVKDITVTQIIKSKKYFFSPLNLNFVLLIKSTFQKCKIWNTTAVICLHVPVWSIWGWRQTEMTTNNLGALRHSVNVLWQPAGPAQLHRTCGCQKEIFTSYHSLFYGRLWLSHVFSLLLKLPQCQHSQGGRTHCRCLGFTHGGWSEEVKLSELGCLLRQFIMCCHVE